MAGHETNRLGALAKHAQRGITEPRGVGDVFHQHLAVAGLQHRRVVGVHADIARKPRLLVEIDGAVGQQRMVARGNLDHLAHGLRVGIAGVVEIGQRQRRPQLVHNGGELLRGRIQPFAGCVEMHIVAIERDIGGDHRAKCAADDQHVGGPGRPARAAAAQWQPDGERE